MCSVPPYNTYYLGRGNRLKITDRYPENERTLPVRRVESSKFFEIQILCITFRIYRWKYIKRLSLREFSHVLPNIYRTTMNIILKVAIKLQRIQVKQIQRNFVRIKGYTESETIYTGRAVLYETCICCL